MQDVGGSINDKTILIESTNFNNLELGSNYTVKEYHSNKIINSDGWKHDSITLKPLSNISSFKDIELTEYYMIDSKAVGIFECVLF
jgi:hypothetical protein